ncbi:TonB-dependent receptor domain-containing protein [Pseudoduganella namucuonensis]|uniref:Outer membrane receptor proteins, mostly Fe transport n=1 Tax=Pseudoduganella namucuonensis TaxID=1035707 RepID=A0A1I7JPA5_9BURK|nr:TonB-dependent receptor [Pseudoduganella namucuonensis]SFU87013.1 Outer membrane receptor proteins, mostly Fe transport [Pseudoduganella namucuonensis]
MNRYPRAARPWAMAAATAIIAMQAPAAAQVEQAPQAHEGAPPPADAIPGKADDVLGLNTVVVTGTSSRRATMRSSVSVSKLSETQIQDAGARSSAELLHSIPGIHVESSGGEGNANISVRGLPVAGGGAKFVQLWEDGLPVLEFGDIAFGNADIFLRADSNIERMEAIRGGSASTLASNSAGGVLNFISKTGREKGGSLGVTRGLNFGQTRYDFEFGGPIGGDWNAHIGGFYRGGEGVRHTGLSERGGQIKGNLTRNFSHGYARLYVKLLDDRAAAYMPQPLLAAGGNADPALSAIPGFDPKRDTPYTPHWTSAYSLDGNNRGRRYAPRDGMHARVRQLGWELNFDLDRNWSILDKGKFAANSGHFIAPFVAESASAASIAAAVGGAGATMRYATGPLAGQAVDPGTVGGNGLLNRTHLFNTEINNLDNFANDLQLSRKLALGGAQGRLLLGLYTARQNIETSWVWSTWLQTVGRDSALVDVYNAAGAKLGEGGLLAYGVPYWGNCCTRYYDMRVDIGAPYLSLGMETGPWNFDASARRDSGKARGRVAGSVQAPFDVNGDGLISAPEQSVSLVDKAHPSPVNYDYGYNSYSAGVNYSVDKDLALFARVSRGGRANADRLAFGKLGPAGQANQRDSVSMVDQYEAGVKFRGRNYGVFVTAFLAKTNEIYSASWEALQQYNRTYRAPGIEIEGSYRRGGFTLDGGVTYTAAKIASDEQNPALVGHRPKRSAKLIYNLAPAYSAGKLRLGASIVGTSSSYAQDSNELVMPGYVVVHPFLQYTIAKGLVATLGVNNLFDKIGITESEDGGITEGVSNIVRQRSIPGRTLTVGLRYEFQ